MFKGNLSIRRKITLGYYLCLLIILAVALLTYLNLWKVDKKVAFAEVIGDFFETTLEARRFEKNYFLFEKEEDYRENKQYISEALQVLQDYPDGFGDITPSLSAGEVARHYTQYSNLMDLAYAHISQNARVPEGFVKKKKALEEQVRRKGKEITDIAEQISIQERRDIRSLLTLSQRTLWVSLGVLIAVGVLLGHTLSTAVVRPLKLLEKHTRLISRGEFRRYEGKVKEEEVASLLDAFNRMTSELENRQRQLVRTEKLASLGTLLSGVAHELNNPLSNISSSVQILAEEIEEPGVEFKRELMAQIEEQSDKARDIVRSLLEFSREKEFKKERVNLRRLVAETKLLVRGQLPSKVEVKVSVPEDIEVVADKQRLQQVFLNLLTNALDAVTEEGHVEVSARQTEDADGRKGVEVEVRDDGAGIEPDKLKRIFDPFFTTKDVGKGAGLGLFITYDIIERHGGIISVNSVPGEGTTFRIKLPQEPA